MKFTFDTHKIKSHTKYRIKTNNQQQPIGTTKLQTKTKEEKKQH